MTLTVQFATMLAMVLSGIYLGIILDTFRRFAKHWKKKKIASYLLEVCFWILQTLILFYILFRVNAGELRLYIFLACLLGFSIYQALLKTYYLRILNWIILISKRIMSVFGRIFSILVLLPLKALFTLCVAVIAFIYRIVIGLILFILKIIGFPFLFLGKLIYSLLPEKIIKILHKLIGFYSTMKNILKKWLKYLTFRRR